MDVQAVLIPAVASLAGVLLGHTLGARRERRSWLRDKQQEAYVAFAVAARAFLFEGDDVGQRADDDARGEVRAAMHRLRDAFTTLNLVAPDDVRDAAYRTKDFFGDDPYEKFMAARADRDDATIEEARKHLEAFEKTARSSLTTERRGWRSLTGR